jgi:hypothetical protein
MLIALGAVFLLERGGYIPSIYWGHWWPGILTMFGILRLVLPRHAGHIGSGVTMILLSAWFFAVEYGWYGLGWHNSWPLALVASGAGMVARAIACRFLPDRREVRFRV